jgi:hypothetical protein
MQFHYGESNRISREVLVHNLFGMFTDSHDRQVRDAIASLVTNNHRPIVATSDGAGYFVARTLHEADHAIAELDSRIGALQARKRGIIAGLTGGNAGQGTLL